MAYTASVSTMHFNCKAIPTNDTDYSCHIKAVYRTCLTNHIGSISHHITLLIITSLRDGHTHTCTHIDTHTHTQTHIHTHTHKHILTRTYTHITDKVNY